VLCLCPTHHALFDRGAFVVLEDLSIRTRFVDGLMARLATTPRHEIGSDYLAYHRRLWETAPGASSSPVS
jgi:putative restriction endonuclease